jgi:tetratricopeptide (TPR) repeat protein
MLTRCVRNDEAVTALQQAVSLAPDHAAARALLADMLRTTGDVEQATAEYRKLLAEQPTAGMAWWGLAELRTTHFTQNDVMVMQGVLQQSNSNNDDLIATGFALAKALDEAGRYAESLAALERANTIARRQRRWNSSAFSDGITATLSAFALSPLGAIDKTLGKEVIFIVSPARSGSTLVEQILASHSSVEGAGELVDLPLVLGEESRRRGMPFPLWVTAMLPEDWARLGQRYLERTAHWRRQRPVFTDKLPNNWMYIGAIRAMLPAARIIVCRRDPLETCFSCYRQHLANNEYTRTFDDLASFWRDFDRGARYWRDLHPSRVFEHCYENLLANPEEHICQLLDFCNLPFELACLNFHETQRTVRSPSATQVRQPLRKDTVHTARYGKLLDELRIALEMPLWVDAPLSETSGAAAVSSSFQVTDQIAHHLEAYDRHRIADHKQAQLALVDVFVGANETDWLACARTLVLRADISTARVMLLAALAEHPFSADLRLALAGVLLESSEHVQVESLLRELLAEQPHHIAAAFLLANLLQQQGRMRAVADTMRALFENGPHDLATVIQSVELLDECDCKQDAAAICESEIANGSTDPRIYAYAGMLEIQLGAFEQARKHYTYALKQSSQALEWNIPTGLSNLQRYEDASHPDFLLFHQSLEQAGLSDKARMAILFALGKAYDDIGDYAQASHYLQQANAVAHAAIPWSRKQWRRSIEARLTRSPILLKLIPDTDWTPIFIVGVPRSGTTLVSELLSHYPDVCNRGELAWLPRLAPSLWLHNQNSVGAFEQAAATYSAQLRKDDSNAHWFIDKQPLNLLHVDLIMALWPNARIIYCKRNPRDTGLSLWSQLFVDEVQGYAYDFSDIAAVVKDCGRLMAHWQKHHASSICTVHYEQLTADPDAVIANLADWLKLPERDKTTPVKNSSTISTASLWQARQPIYIRSVGRWRHYDPYLPELKRLPER